MIWISYVYNQLYEAVFKAEFLMTTFDKSEHIYLDRSLVDNVLAC